MEFNDRDFPNRNEIFALALAFLPFVCSFTDTTRETVNGRVVSETSYDYADVILGALAVLAGLALARMIPSYAGDSRLKHLAVVAVVLAVGAFQMLSGADVL